MSTPHSGQRQCRGPADPFASEATLSPSTAEVGGIRGSSADVSRDAISKRALDNVERYCTRSDKKENAGYLITTNDSRLSGLLGLVVYCVIL